MRGGTVNTEALIFTFAILTVLLTLLALAGKAN
jgi:hypothetical protein